MPAPISGSSSPIIPSTTTANTSTAATTGTAAATAAAAAAPAAPVTPPATGAVRADSMDPAAPSRFEKLRGKAVAAVWEQVANNHHTGKDVSFGNITGNIKISEEIAIRGTTTFTNMVANDRRRAAVSSADSEQVWVKTTGAVGATAGLPVTIAAGVGASIGFNGAVEVTAIASHDVSGARDIAKAVGNQAKAMVLPIDSDGLVGMNAKPGTEWMFRGTIGANAGIGASIGASIGGNAGVASGSVGATASVGISGAASMVYSKNVKVLENGKVFVSMSRVDSAAANVGAAVTVGLNANTNGAISGAASTTDRAADRIADRIENATRITSSVNFGGGLGHKVMGAAVLDLTTAAGKASYDHLMRSNPNEAADYLTRTGLGLRYTETSNYTASSASVQFGRTNLLATSTFKGTTNGVMEEPGNTTTLSQADYNRSVAGFLPRLFVGEERTVAVRAGELTKNGSTQRAVAVTMNVKDRKLNQTELAQNERFATAMGMPFQGLPKLTANETAKDSQFSVQVALTNEDVTRMQAWSDGDVRLAFAQAHKDIDGNAALPLYYENPGRFDWYAGEASVMSGDDMGRRSNAIADYKTTTGRDLLTDMDSKKAIDRMVGQLGAVRGKPVEDWGKLLESVGKQSSNDVRAAVLGLRRLAQAEVVNMSLTVKGVTAAATPEASASLTLGEQVGALLSPPG